MQEGNVLEALGSEIIALYALSNASQPVVSKKFKTGP